MSRQTPPPGSPQSPVGSPLAQQEYPPDPNQPTYATPIGPPQQLVGYQTTPQLQYAQSIQTIQYDNQQIQNLTPPPPRFVPQHLQPYGRPDFNIVQQLQNREMGIQRYISYAPLYLTPRGTQSLPIPLLPTQRNRYPTPQYPPPMSGRQLFTQDSPPIQGPLYNNPWYPIPVQRRFYRPTALSPLPVSPSHTTPRPSIPTTLPNVQNNQVRPSTPEVYTTAESQVASTQNQLSSGFDTAGVSQASTSQLGPDNVTSTNMRAQQNNDGTDPQGTSRILEERSKSLRLEKRSRPDSSPEPDIPSKRRAYHETTPARRTPPEQQSEIRASAVRRATTTLPNIHNNVHDQPTSNALRTVDERWFIRHTVPDTSGERAGVETIGRRHREVQVMLQENLLSQKRSVRLSIDEALEMFKTAIETCLGNTGGARSLHPLNNITQIRELSKRAYELDIAQAIPPQPFALSRDYKTDCFRCKGGVNQINAFYLKCGHVYCMACILEKHFKSPLLVCDCGLTHGVSFTLLSLHGLYDDGRVIEPAVISWQFSDENLMYYTWRRLQYYNQEQCRQDGFDMYFSTI